MWQCPPQYLQSPPHWMDFPFLLSLTIDRMTNATTTANAAPTKNVPMFTASVLPIHSMIHNGPAFAEPSSLF